MLNFRGANTKSKCAKGAMSRCVRISAHNRHARLSNTKLWSNNVNNSLILIAK